MAELMSRRSFTMLTTGLVLGSATDMKAAEDKPKAAAVPTEAPFERDYPAPSFKPSWKKAQINRTQVQDFVIFGHSDLPMVKKMM